MYNPHYLPLRLADVQGGFVGCIVGRDPSFSPSATGWSHAWDLVVVLDCFAVFLNRGCSKSIECRPVVSQTQPVHL